MIWTAVLTLLYALLSGAAYAQSASEKQEIPLSEIISNAFPGTQKVTGRKGEGMKYVHPHGADVRAIFRWADLRNQRMTQPGFMVHGVGSEALKNAVATLKEERSVTNTAKHGDQVSLFFYVDTTVPAELCGVSTTGSEVEIRYRFTPRRSRLDDSINYFALIPITCSKIGEVKVVVSEEPFTNVDNLNQLDLNRRNLATHTSKSFSFQVAP